MIKRYIRLYWENGKHYAEAWSQLNVFGKCYCFFRRKIEIQSEEIGAITLNSESVAKISAADILKRDINPKRCV